VTLELVNAFGSHRGHAVESYVIESLPHLHHLAMVASRRMVLPYASPSGDGGYQEHGLAIRFTLWRWWRMQAPDRLPTHAVYQIPNDGLATDKFGDRTSMIDHWGGPTIEIGDHGVRRIDPEMMVNRRQEIACRTHPFDRVLS
jgi:hypothetical protein